MFPCPFSPRQCCLSLLFFFMFIVLAMTPTGAAEPDEGTPAVRRLPRENLLLYVDKQDQQQPVRSLEDWKWRRQETLRGMQAVMGRYPGAKKRCDLDVQVVEEVDAGSYIQREITYQSEPGCRTPAYLLIPKTVLTGKVDKVPGVLCLHPTHAQGPKGMVGVIDVENRAYGKELAERGYVVIAPNYPHLADYKPDLKALGWKSGTMKAIWDNHRALDLLDTLPYVQEWGYATIGHSLGGHNSVYTALFDSRLKVVISSCGLDSYLDYYKENPNVWQPGRGWTQERYIPLLANYAGRLEQIPFDFHEMVAALAPAHVLIIAPTNDHNFKAESVDRVVAAAKPVFELHGVPERLQLEHPDAKHDFPPEMREKAYQLIDSVLKD